MHAKTFIGGLSAAICVLVLSFGCEKSDGTCGSDKDCPDGYICLDGECVHLGECLTDAHCPDGAACIQGICVVRATPNECSTDAQCRPPSTVCSGGTCVEGCSTTGCAPGERCDTNTGRCVPFSGCFSDADCSPPQTVCSESGDCVEGCVSAGCPAGFDCDEATGRCENLSPECAFDSDCDPPDMICDAWQGLCVPGCVSAGCPGDLSCDESTGRCFDDDIECFVDQDCDPGRICEEYECVEGCRTNGDCPSGKICDGGECLPHCMEAPCQSPMLCEPSSGICEEPGPVPMGGACFDQEGEPDHSLCASDYCFPGSGTCTRPCTASMQCDVSGWQCLNVEPMGARACGYNAGTGTGAPGDPCGNCKTHWCWDGKCTDDCQHRRDCPQPGYVCRVLYGEATGYLDVPICATPAGGGTTGQSCSGGEQCQSEICLAGRCADPCHTSFDCPSGHVCTLVPATNGSAVRLCTEADGPTGSEGPGAPCDPSTHLPCRSRLCVELEDDIGFCIDTCASHDDCGNGMRCEIMPIDTTGDGSFDQTVPVCLFR